MEKKSMQDQQGMLLAVNAKEGEFSSNISFGCIHKTCSECLIMDCSSHKINDCVRRLKKSIKKPYELLRHVLEMRIRNRSSWSDDLASDIPKSWMKLGDMILFDSKCFLHPIWKLEGDDLFPTICMCLNAEKLGRKFAIQPDGYRTPMVEMLWGANSWVTITDNKISYSLDVMKCMFSGGNASERQRMSQMDCEGETIVDLFAGIGYFTIPLLRHANASFVHACEWNPDAVEALKFNLKQNNVASRCKIHEGDNREVSPVNVADRVVMGLIPSCEQSIIAACKALKSCSGGIMHMHENVSSFAKDELPFVFNNESLELVRESCVDCASILSTFPGGDMLIDKTKDTISLKRAISANFILQGGCCKPVWTNSSPIFWKRKEWLIQAVHFSHKICTFISNYHQTLWQVEVLGCHHVKSYAPHIDHLVFDLNCSPLNII